MTETPMLYLETDLDKHEIQFMVFGKGVICAASGSSWLLT